MEAEAVLGVSGLRVGHRGDALLPAISFEVRPGEAWGIVGPNGAGKTTLLRTLLGLLRPVDGAFRSRPRDIGYVPQRTRLDTRIPGRVIDVVRLGSDRGWSFLRPGLRGGPESAVQLAMKTTDTVELQRERFASLSEGQKQRVLIARAMVGEPGLLVLDEPTSAMDLAAEHRVMRLVRSLADDRDVAVLMVSHHLAIVARFATHLIVVDRDASVALAGRLADVARSAFVVSTYGDIFAPGRLAIEDCTDDAHA